MQRVGRLRKLRWPPRERWATLSISSGNPDFEVDSHDRHIPTKALDFGHQTNQHTNELDLGRVINIELGPRKVIRLSSRLRNSCDPQSRPDAQVSI